MNERKSLTIIGYGSQGKAWAANLRDAGYLVNVVLPSTSASQTQAQADGFMPISIEDSRWPGDNFAFLIPDHLQANFLARHQQRFAPGSTLIFAHGYSVVFDDAPLPAGCEVALIAPKASGTKLRERFLAGQPTLVVAAFHRDAKLSTRNRMQTLADDLTGGRCKFLESTFAEECMANLFAEQALTCGTLPGLVAETYNIMLERGIHQELAFQECFHNLAMIAEMLRDYGIDGTYERVSLAARTGGKSARRFMIDANFRNKLNFLFDEIRNGNFSRMVTSVQNNDQGSEAAASTTVTASPV